MWFAGESAIARIVENALDGLDDAVGKPEWA